MKTTKAQIEKIKKKAKQLEAEKRSIIAIIKTYKQRLKKSKMSKKEKKKIMKSINSPRLIKELVETGKKLAKVKEIIKNKKQLEKEADKILDKTPSKDIYNYAKKKLIEDLRKKKDIKKQSFKEIK